MLCGISPWQQRAAGTRLPTNTSTRGFETEIRPGARSGASLPWCFTLALPSSFPSSWWNSFLLLFKNPPDTRARNLSGAVGLAAGDSGTSCVPLLLSPNSFSPLGMILASGPAGAVKNSCEAPCFAVTELHTAGRWGGSLPPDGVFGVAATRPGPAGLLQHQHRPVPARKRLLFASLLGACPDVPSPGAFGAVAAALCTHKAMFRSGDSLSSAALGRKPCLCSLLVFRALWVPRAPLDLVCVTGCAAWAEGLCFGGFETQLNSS